VSRVYADQLDVSVHVSTATIRNWFTDARSKVADWEPAPCPPATAASTASYRTPYLDEIERPTRWLR